MSILIFNCRPDIGTTIPDSGHNDTTADTGSCTTTDPYCSFDRTQVLVCDPRDDTEMVLQTCPDGQSCIQGACNTLICTPGQVECVDSTTERACQPDGLGWEERDCGEDYRCLDNVPGCATPCTLRVFILLDSSGSMGDEMQPTKWEQARDALATLMQTAISQPVEFGLGTFPSSGGDCSVDEQVIYPVPQATPANVDAYFVDYSPVGNTPLLFALDHVSETAAGLDDPAYANFVLLVSDGSDTCWEENCVAQCGLLNVWCIINCENEADQEVIRLLGESSARLRDESSIRTFVIGFGSGVSDEELTAIAENGGTVLGRWLPASDVDELSAAFESVLQEMLDCNPIVY